MARMNKTETGILLKFFDKEYTESLEKGQIYFSKLSYFSSNSELLTDAQADGQEAKYTKVLDNKKNKLFFDDMKTEEYSRRIHFEYASINLELPEADVANMFISSFVFLNYKTDLNKVDDKLYIKESVIEGISKIANNRPYAIFYIDELIDNIKKQMPNRGYTIYCDLVKYTNQRDTIKYNFDVEPINLAFTKREKYVNQKEYRILIYNPNGLRPESLVLPTVCGSNGQQIFEFENLHKLSFRE